MKNPRARNDQTANPIQSYNAAWNERGGESPRYTFLAHRRRRKEQKV